MSAETNYPLASNPELQAKAETLLAAANDYWREYKHALGGAGVVWVSDANGNLLVFTRGEYREELLRNIARLQRDDVPAEWRCQSDAPAVSMPKGDAR